MGCALAPKSRHDLLQLPSGTRVRHETRGDATVFLRDGENRLHLVFDTGEVTHGDRVCVRDCSAVSQVWGTFTAKAHLSRRG